MSKINKNIVQKEKRYPHHIDSFAPWETWPRGGQGWLPAHFGIVAAFLGL